jgi:hypothetical protein
VIVRSTAAFLLLFLLASITFAQRAQTAGERRAQSASRQRGQSRGRRIRADSADLRRHAILHKLQMRAVGMTTPNFSSTGWNSLGPLQLPSDASGIGLQDYGWVAGRATAVAIDPNDASGNTVFAGGAYDGVWKSSNAGSLSPNPGTVIWTPVTDDQATLAI